MIFVQSAAHMGGKPILCLAGHDAFVRAVAYSRDGSLIFSGAWDGTVIVWGAADGSRRYPQYDCQSHVESLAVSPTSQFIACGLFGGRIKVFDRKRRALAYKPMMGHSEVVHSLAYSPDGEIMVSGSNDGSICLWKADTGDLLRYLLLNDSWPVNAVAFSPDGSPDGNLIVSASSALNIWNREEDGTWSANEVPSNCPQHDSFRSAVFSPDGSSVICCAQEGILQVVDVHSRKMRKAARSGPPCTIVAVSWDGKFLATGVTNSFIERVFVWTVEAPLPVASPTVRPSNRRMIDDTKKLPVLPQPVSVNTEAHPDTYVLAQVSHQKAVITLDELWNFLCSADSARSASPRDWTGHLKKAKHVGSGGFGDVYQGQWRDTGVLPAHWQAPAVAVKVVRLHCIQVGSAANAMKQLNREVEVWQSIQHNNIVPFVGITFDFGEESQDSKIPSLVSLWMPNGSLRGYLLAHPEVPRTPLLLDMARGIDYLHQCKPGITHGDIKAENVLVDELGSARIIDFGISNMLSDDTLWVTTATSAPGTVRWMAPELLDGTSNMVTYPADVYAFAMTCVEVITGRFPFWNYRFNIAVVNAVAYKNERPKRPDNMRDWLWSLLNDCWVREPSDRPNMSEVVRRLEDVLVPA